METQEITAPESTQPVNLQDNTSTENQQVENQQVDNPQERNWRAFREQRERERKQKEEAERLALQKSQEAEALKAALEAYVSKPNYQNTYEIRNEDESEDERLKKKIESLLAEKERKMEEQRRQREQQEFPQRLVQTYPDFEKVCTTENLDYIEYHYPEITAGFKHMPDGYDKWSSIYKAVKRFIPNPESKKDQLRAEKNLTKPQSMAVPGVTSTGDSTPYQLDEKKRLDNWKRMQRVMKGVA